MNLFKCFRTFCKRSSNEIRTFYRVQVFAHERCQGINLNIIGGKDDEYAILNHEQVFEIWKYMRDNNYIDKWYTIEYRERENNSNEVTIIREQKHGPKQFINCRIEYTYENV